MTTPIAPSAIPQFGTPPSTQDPANFDNRMDGTLAKLVPFVDATNAASAATYQNAVSANESAVSADADAESALLSKNAAALSETNSGISAGTASADAASALLSKNAAELAATQVDVAGALAGLPPRAGNSLKAVRVNASETALEYFDAASIQRLHVLSTAASTKYALTAMLPIFNKKITVTGQAIDRIMWCGSQFVAAPSVATATVWTSPDGLVWTGRTMGVSGTQHYVRNNGANIIGIYTASTTARVSTDGGVTWAASAAASGNLLLGNLFAYTSGGVFLTASTTQAYVTTNNGSSWSALQTLPHTSTYLFAAGANLVSYSNASNTYYTSTTGLTGSWTARTLPDSVSAGTIWDDGSGGLILIPTVTTKNFWGTADGVTWADLGFNASSYAYGGLADVSGTFTGAPVKINGCWTVFNTATAGSGGVGALVKYAGDAWIPMYVDIGSISSTVPTSLLVAKNSSGITLALQRVATPSFMLIDTTLTNCMGNFI